MIIQQAKLMLLFFCVFVFVLLFFFTHVCDNVFYTWHFVFHSFLLNSSCVCICVGVS